MAMVDCPECGAQVSESAVACPQCGYAFKRKSAFNVKRLLAWVIGVPVACYVALMVIGALLPDSVNERTEAEARKRCANAIMSNMGTSTVGYQDKQAYDARVKEACEGFDLSK